MHSVKVILRLWIDLRNALLAVATCITFTLSIVSFSALADDNLWPEVTAELMQYGLPADSISIVIEVPEVNKTLLSYNADVPRNPASTMKLLTTYAALDMLGPGYRWETGFFIDGPITDGVLEGNLYIRASGDPMILTEDFLRILFRLRQRGLREIHGNLVVDDSIFDINSIDTRPIDDQPYRAYHAYPGPLSINFRATRFEFIPTNDGVTILADPPASTLHIDNRLKTIDGPCNGMHRAMGIDVNQGIDVTKVTFSGNYPRKCGERQITRSVLNADDYLFGVFQSIWSGLGGDLNGTLKRGAIPQDADEILLYESHSLLEVLSGINKYSNNFMARSLLLTLGVATYGSPATVETGQVALRSWLNTRGLPMPGLNIDNGAGFSRDARITAGGLANLLKDVLKHPYREELLASMSLAGIDGSLQKRFNHSAVNGHYRLKTGLLRDVRAAAGYGHTARGTLVVVVILQNAPGLTYSSGNAIQDAILRHLYEHY
ncbi:MAG: peptidase [marine bacterium B5-7]|nr:MAG: peptidase [marine bacterium B5-7]